MPEARLGFQQNVDQKGAKFRVLRMKNSPPLFVKLCFEDDADYNRLRMVLEKVRKVKE